ncbi:type II toxin-antitoxin system RelE/ParE family toxin [Slackia exigua]|uniref:type II toxin-antitoxin system RelE/ParE family toxin n=1 Tax=Slackia exigua TaxID=84109 RepID=UPI0028D0C57A|nr:type II toxin-antitoxin system RelE/ParE family toxin [Slackia exigua]
MHEVEWRPRAQLDRESIAIYLGLECKNPQAALSTIRMIDDAIRQVQAFPDMGRRVILEDAAHHDYRRVLNGMYAVYYRFDSKRIVVYRILHQRRDIADYSFVDLDEDV